MARLRDWLDLGRSTVTSITQDDVTNLYSLEWPETKKMLIAEHSDGTAIQSDPKAIRRMILPTVSVRNTGR